jgi:hypothetical protein
MRDKLSADDFAGPHQSFPVKTQEDVYAAVHSLGRAGGRTAPIKAGIRRIARRKGLKLPDSWTQKGTKNSWQRIERDWAQETATTGVRTWNRQSRRSYHQWLTRVTGEIKRACQQTRNAFLKSREIQTYPYPQAKTEQAFTFAGNALRQSRLGHYRKAAKQHQHAVVQHQFLGSYYQDLGAQQLSLNHYTAANLHETAAKLHSDYVLKKVRQRLLSA